MTERIPMESYSLSTHAKGCDPCMKLVGQLTCAVLWQHENRGRAKEALWREGGSLPTGNTSGSFSLITFLGLLYQITTN